MNGNVFTFLKNNSTEILNDSHLIHVKKTILEINSNFPYPINNLCIPNNLDKFDLSSCYSILRNLTGEIPKKGRWDENLSSMDPNDHSLAANFNRLRLIRNVNFGHLITLKLNDHDYDYYKHELKRIITGLCDDQNMKEDYEKKIDSVLSSSYSDKEIFKKYREEIIDLMIGHKEDLIKEIEKLDIKDNNEYKQEIKSLYDLLKYSNDNDEIRKKLNEIIENEVITSMVSTLDEISLSLSELTNQNKYSTIVSEMNENKYDNTKFDNLKKDILDLREDKTLIRLSSNVPNESIRNFIRKEALFKEIEDIFSKSNKDVIISGYAGSGKTTLALKYAHEQNDENNKIVRWFNAESKDFVWNDYKNLATQELRIGNEINERQIIINLVNSRLQILGLNILFVFDNAKDADDINELIINLPRNVQTIITTKNNNLKDNFKFGNGSNLEMKPFNKGECIEYINIQSFLRDILNEINQNHHQYLLLLCIYI
ncbi:unnamed protein product [Didymodactylos carnosus]|uniref:NB-ARC domain-containing protein n=1 Tax=Didymodactylos carnosus TaxID=1234261 RepID=A0A8S2EII8_9BILA|nr:unnamed protein product [Didymodactylos carnosus]CAF4043212.1 unnamed protein product [Didymodactylos carnosus]